MPSSAYARDLLAPAGPTATAPLRPARAGDAPGPRPPALRPARPGVRPPAREHRFGWLAPMVVWPTARWLLPAPARRPQGGGTRRRDDEALFAAVSFILTSRAPWRAVPPGFGVSWQHAHRSFRHWSDHGTWDRLALVAHSRQAPDQVRYWADRLAASAAGRGCGREPEDPG